MNDKEVRSSSKIRKLLLI